MNFEADPAGNVEALSSARGDADRERLGEEPWTTCRWSTMPDYRRPSEVGLRRLSNPNARWQPCSPGAALAPSGNHHPGRVHARCADPARCATLARLRYDL